MHQESGGPQEPPQEAAPQLEPCSWYVVLMGLGSDAGWGGGGGVNLGAELFPLLI